MPIITTHQLAANVHIPQVLGQIFACVPSPLDLAAAAATCSPLRAAARTAPARLRLAPDTARRAGPRFDDSAWLSAAIAALPLATQELDLCCPALQDADVQRLLARLSHLQACMLLHLCFSSISMLSTCRLCM